MELKVIRAQFNIEKMCVQYLYQCYTLDDLHKFSKTNNSKVGDLRKSCWDSLHTWKVPRYIGTYTSTWFLKIWPVHLHPCGVDKIAFQLQKLVTSVSVVPPTALKVADFSTTIRRLEIPVNCTTMTETAGMSPEEAAAARVAEQARIRKERREAKIKAGGSARLNRITGLGGGVQRGMSIRMALRLRHVSKIWPVLFFTRQSLTTGASRSSPFRTRIIINLLFASTHPCRRRSGTHRAAPRRPR